MGLTNNLRIFLAIEPCDMRKSFNGLTALADELNPDSLKNGALFLFTNKRRNRLKALCCDRTGMCVLVLAKRLEIGTFSWPTPSRRTPPKWLIKPPPETRQLGSVLVPYSMSPSWLRLFKRPEVIQSFEVTRKKAEPLARLGF